STMRICHVKELHTPRLMKTMKKPLHCPQAAIMLLLHHYQQLSCPSFYHQPFTMKLTNRGNQLKSRSSHNVRFTSSIVEKHLYFTFKKSNFPLRYICRTTTSKLPIALVNSRSWCME
ncbi:hypothetical protein Dimus_005475, partial [Dionaea muscipula]